MSDAPVAPSSALASIVRCAAARSPPCARGRHAVVHQDLISPSACSNHTCVPERVLARTVFTTSPSHHVHRVVIVNQPDRCNGKRGDAPEACPLPQVEHRLELLGDEEVPVRQLSRPNRTGRRCNIHFLKAMYRKEDAPKTMRPGRRRGRRSEGKR